MSCSLSAFVTFAARSTTSTNSTVRVLVNGSSGGCFNGDSAHGALLPVDQEGVAWVSGHFRAADERAIMSTPFAVRIPSLPNRVHRDDSGDGRGNSQLNISFGAPKAKSKPSATISAVLLLTLDDANRARLLMKTLRTCGALDLFHDFFVVVRGRELARIRDVLGTDGGSAVVMIDEEQLLLEMLLSDDHNGAVAAAVIDGRVGAGTYHRRRGETYALQMILKLLAASLMRTPYYLTLDADVLCTKSRLSERDLLPHDKGNYMPER